MGKGGSALDLERRLVHVAPPPLLAGLERSDDGMAAVMEVGGGMAIG
jgi:hypothetical protein